MSNLAGPRFHSQKHRHSIRVWEIPFHPFASNQNLTFTPLFGQDVGSGEWLAGRGPNIYIQCLVSVKLESQFFSLQKDNLLVRKVQYLHTKFSFSMSLFLRNSQIFSVTCGCVQKLNIYKIYLENLRFSSPVIEFFYQIFPQNILEKFQDMCAYRPVICFVLYLSYVLFGDE